VEAAIKQLNKDLDGVIEGMSRISGREDRTIYDPGLLEFAAEIIGDALERASQPGAAGLKREKLVRIQGRLIGLLRRVRMREWTGG
jgi:hypothetical protein